MRHTRIFQIIGFVALLVFVIGGFGFRSSDDNTPPAAATAAGPMSTTEAIAFFAGRVEATPTDAVSATILGELHNRRARETGDVGEYTLALRSMEQASQRLPEYAPARLALATSRFGLHQFEEAAAEARVAADLDPKSGAEVVVADVAVATGDYQTAGEIYQALRSDFDSPSLEARIAHLSEIAGDYPSALETMTQARTAAENQNIGGEALAWFDLRLGDLTFATGEYRLAENHYRNSLGVFPRYPSAVAGLARALGAQGNADESGVEFERSIAMQPLPQVLLDAARFYESTGDTDRAAAHRNTIDVIAELSNGVYDRAIVHHLVDVERCDEALEKAEALAAGRTDTYTLDTLAWAQFCAGDPDASATIERALGHGSADPQVLYHAGMILSGSDPTRAADFLSRALDISPNFDPLGAARAREALSDLGR